MRSALHFLTRASSPRALTGVRCHSSYRCRSRSRWINSSCPLDIAEGEMSPFRPGCATRASTSFRCVSRTVAAALGLALATACAHVSQQTAEAPAPCVGQRMLVVNNHTDLTVDVYAYSRGSTPRFVGT